jgi:hypothetical protein
LSPEKMAAAAHGEVLAAAVTTGPSPRGSSIDVGRRVREVGEARGLAAGGGRPPCRLG